jgi:hypothetical protein
VDTHVHPQCRVDIEDLSPAEQWKRAAAAMKIRHPAFQPAAIPVGAYVGERAAPSEDLPTAAVHRGMLASIVRIWCREVRARMAAVRPLLSQAPRPEGR